MPTKNQTFTIADDFPSAAVDAEAFRQEILADQSDPVSVWEHALETVTSDGTICYVDFKVDITQAEADRLVELAGEHQGEPYVTSDTVTFADELLDADGRLRAVAEDIVGAEKYFYVHNLCDPCAWWEGAQEVVEATLSNPSGDQQTYTDTHKHWIDLTHGRVFREDAISGRDDFIPVIEVSTDGGSTWTAKVENTWDTTDGDYRVDYEAGAVIFNAKIDPADQVRASFYYADNSTFTVKPTTGKRLKLKYVEVQFTTDVKMSGSVYFDIYLAASVVAAMLQASSDPDEQADGAALQAAIDGGAVGATDPYLVKSEAYKRIIDFYQESTGPFPTVPQIGAGSERGLNTPLATIPFNYLAVRDLRSSQGAEIRVRIEGDQPFKGEFANATFYCLSEDE